MIRKPRVLFRADASSELGFGHVARVCALVEETEAHGCEPVLLFGGDPASVRSWAQDHGLDADVRDWSVTQVLQEAAHPRTTAVVVDGPPLAAALVPKLPAQLRSIVLDDVGRLPYEMSAVVNHNVHAPGLAATYPRAHQRLLGRRYLMLRRDIRRYMRGSCRPSGQRRLRVVVTFGGSDPPNATSRVLALVPDDRPLELIVIAGPGFRHHEALQQAAEVARSHGHDVDIRHAPDDPGGLFVSADAAICSAGGTLGELAYLGCPALAFAIVADQVAPLRVQHADGLVAGGHPLDAVGDDLVHETLRAFLTDDELRASVRRRALATADSDGAKRVVEEAIAP